MEEIMKQDKEKSRQENEYLISIITKKYEDELAEKDKEITRLRVEVEALRSGQKHLASKKASISNALVAAVDKAKEIENSSKKVYELKSINFQPFKHAGKNFSRKCSKNIQTLLKPKTFRIWFKNSKTQCSK